MAQVWARGSWSPGPRVPTPLPELPSDSRQDSPLWRQGGGPPLTCWGLQGGGTPLAVPRGLTSAALPTQANTGQIDDPREQYRVVSSNLALVQVSLPLAPKRSTLITANPCILLMEGSRSHSRGGLAWLWTGRVCVQFLWPGQPLATRRTWTRATGPQARPPLTDRLPAPCTVSSMARTHPGSPA